MKKIFAALLVMTTLSAGHEVGDFTYHLDESQWRVSEANPGYWFFDVAQYTFISDKVQISCTQRNTLSSDLNTFVTSLQPYEQKLIPFILRGYEEEDSCLLESEEDVDFLGFPAKKLTFHIMRANKDVQHVITYAQVLKKPVSFAHKNVAYTHSFAFAQENYRNGIKLVTRIPNCIESPFSRKVEAIQEEVLAPVVQEEVLEPVVQDALVESDPFMLEDSSDEVEETFTNDEVSSM